MSQSPWDGGSTLLQPRRWEFCRYEVQPGTRPRPRREQAGRLPRTFAGCSEAVRPPLVALGYLPEQSDSAGDEESPVVRLVSAPLARGGTDSD
jgi:hypothetical protein